MSPPSPGLVTPPARVCERCHASFARRRDARFCCNACRQFAYRQRNWTWATVSWNHKTSRGVNTFAASWRFFRSREAALAAAPVGKVWSVVDISRGPWLTYLDITELLARREW